MSLEKLFTSLVSATSITQVETAIETFAECADGISWVPVGNRENNRGQIEVSADPGRSLIERLTNGIDAVLEAEYMSHGGLPRCLSPREASQAWFNVPASGLSGLSPAQRRSFAQRVVISLLPGEDSNSRTIDVRDYGVGLSAEEMPRTILSLGESNKVQKHYLAGTYGQGGSSTLAVSKYTLIVSKSRSSSRIGFTVAFYEDLPPEEYKTGRYVYMLVDGQVPSVDHTAFSFDDGTLVRHFGYDLSGYPSPLGPRSVYGLLNQVLFDPILPIWLDSRVHDYRRVIKGSRNALNGAIDEGDDDRRGPSLSHNVPMFHVNLADYGSIGIEYWVLEPPTRQNDVPIRAFVNPTKPIILTQNGQNHAEFSRTLIRKETDLPYLVTRLICHIDCNHLTPEAKRLLFVSSREDVRRGTVYDMLQQEIIRALKSDDELVRLNNQSREDSMRAHDESAAQEMRSEVARLLRMHGLNVTTGRDVTTGGTQLPSSPPRAPRRPRPTPTPIDLNDPPTYIRIIWDENTDIGFYQHQRRYIRIETDALSGYHDADNPSASRINFISSSADLILKGSTQLLVGRLRAIFEASGSVNINDTGTIRVELTRPGLTTLSDERQFRIVPTPPGRPAVAQIQLPPFDVRPVRPEDQMWTILDWPTDLETIASSAEMDNEKLVIYYSVVFPKFSDRRTAFERRDPSLAISFTKRYEIWLAVHSLLIHEEQSTQASRIASEEEQEERYERAERCRIATLAALFAARETESVPNAPDVE